MDEQSVSRARWSVVERRLQRLEQAAGLPNPPPKGGPAMARTPQEVDALIDQMETRQDDMESTQETRDEEVKHRLGRLIGLVDRLQVSIRGVEDRTDANTEQINLHDRWLRRLTNPLRPLLQGLVGVVGLFLALYWVKTRFGDNMPVTVDGKEALLRDAPWFWLASDILWAAMIFAVGFLIFLYITDVIWERRPTANAQHNQPPPVVAAEDLEDEGNEGGDEPQPEPEPTQVLQAVP